MGLFSSTPALDGSIEMFLSPFWTPQDVQKVEYKWGMEKLAKAQDTIRTALRPGEDLVVIVPCFAQNTGYKGIFVLTSERLMYIKGRRVAQEMQRSHLAEVKQFASPNGHFVLQFISQDAQPFAAFAKGDPSSGGGAKFWAGTIQIPLSSSPPGLKDFLVMRVES